MAGSLITAAGIGGEGNQKDESATGLQYQHLNIDANATGYRLGRGARTTPSPNTLFSHPPISNVQFGEGANPREAMHTDEETEEEG